MFNLLPLAALSALPPQPVHLDSQDALEQRLYGQLHAALGAGWKLVDERDDASSIAITIGKGDAGEQLVADLDQLTFLEQVARPDAGSFDATEAAMLADARGGLVIDSDCGSAFLRTYVIEDEARGRAAQRLVASALATADDLESATIDDGVAELDVTRGGDAMSIYADLDAHGRVARAEVRRWNARADLTTYQRMARLDRAVAGGRVTGFAGDETDVTLVAGKRRFAIDPSGDAFRVIDPDDGCGC